MAKVTGVGGIFYKVEDAEATARWYKEVLGVGGQWGATFAHSNDAGGYTMLTQFKATTEYFAPSDKGFMINLRVDDLDGMVADLESKGVEILGRQDEEYGKFAWILDCDGVKVELFEQIGDAPE